MAAIGMQQCVKLLPGGPAALAHSLPCCSTPATNGMHWVKVLTSVKCLRIENRVYVHMLKVCTAVVHTAMLSAQIMPRTANLEAAAASSSGPPPEQDVPLDVPKKTRLYVEQTQREREQAVDMHRVFQRDLLKMRLATARAYVKVLTDGQVSPLCCCYAQAQPELSASAGCISCLCVQQGGCRLQRSCGLRRSAPKQQLWHRQHACVAAISESAVFPHQTPASNLPLSCCRPHSSV